MVKLNNEQLMIQERNVLDNNKVNKPILKQIATKYKIKFRSLMSAKELYKTIRKILKKNQGEHDLERDRYEQIVARQEEIARLLEEQRLEDIKNDYEESKFTLEVEHEFLNRRGFRYDFELKNNVNIPATLEEFYDNIMIARKAIKNIVIKRNDGVNTRFTHLINNIGMYVTLQFFVKAEYDETKDDMYNRHITRSIPVTDSFKGFKLAVDSAMQHVSGHGSEASIEDVNLLNMKKFSQTAFALNQGGGAKDRESIDSKYYFNTNIKTDNNNCLIGAMVIFTKINKKVKTIRKELVDMGIKEGELITLEQIPIVEKYFGKSIAVLSDDKFNDYLYKSKDVEQADASVLLKDNHYSLITKVKKEVLDKERKEIERQTKKDNMIIKYLFFDFETVFDRNDENYLKPYSVSWFVHDNGNVFEFNKAKHEGLAVFMYGFDCVKKLVTFILNTDDNIKYKIIGFNNSKFDNFFLASECAKRDVLSELFYVNNSILNLNIYRHDTLDARRFLPPDMSLSKACSEKGMNTNPKKIEGYSHEIPQQQFENGTLIKWIEDNLETVSTYNKYDVLSLCDLTCKLNSSMFELCGKNVYDYNTLAQLGWDHFIANNKEKFARMKNFEDDKFARSAMTAGRTQAHRGPLSLENDSFKLVDVKSLYPFVMNRELYPCKEYTKTENYVKDKLGIYKCTILNQNCKWLYGKPEVHKGYEYLEREFAPVIFPRRSADEPLDWEYRGQMDVNLSSVDIELIIKYCGREAIVVKDGIYWEESEDTAFKEFLEPFKNEKTKQDLLNSNNDKNYNPCKREVCKLMQNGLSGKTIQRNFTDITKRITCESDINKFLEKVEIKEDVEISKITNNVIFYKGKISEEKAFKDTSKPSYLGVFIYAYARRYMYETILSKYTVLYQDTDSALLFEKDFNKLQNERKDLFEIKDKTKGLEYGQLEEELGECKKIIIISPKNYLCEAFDKKKNKDTSKRKFKGIKGNDTYLLLKDMDEFKNYTKEQLIEMNNKGELRLTMDKVEKYMKKANKCMTNDMFKEMYEKEPLCIFTSQLKKNMNYYKIDMEENMKSKISIKQIFMMKLFNL